MSSALSCSSGMEPSRYVGSQAMSSFVTVWRRLWLDLVVLLGMMVAGSRGGDWSVSDVLLLLSLIRRGQSLYKPRSKEIMRVDFLRKSKKSEICLSGLFEGFAESPCRNYVESVVVSIFEADVEREGISEGRRGFPKAFCAWIPNPKVGNEWIL